MLQGGSKSLNTIGERLVRVGTKDLRVRVQHAISESLQEIEGEIREKPEQVLPTSGGLNKWVEESTMFERSKQVAPQLFGTWIVNHKEGHSLKDIDRGRIKHPVFGKSGTAVFQKIPAGYFSKTIITKLPLIKKRIEHAAIKAIRGE